MTSSKIAVFKTETAAKAYIECIILGNRIKSNLCFDRFTIVEENNNNFSVVLKPKED